MSWRASAYVKLNLLAPRVTLSEKMVMYTLAECYRDETGYTCPSVPHLSYWSLLSERQAQRCLRSLVAKGIIAGVPGPGRGHTTQYSFPELPAVGLKKSGIKGDTVTPFTDSPSVKGDRVTLFPVHPIPEKVTGRVVKGDITMSPKQYNSKNKSSFNSDLSRTLEARQDWNKIAAELKPVVKVQDWDTWIRPLRGAGIEAKTLVVRAPAREIAAWVREHWADAIVAAAKKLGLDWQGVRIVVRRE